MKNEFLARGHYERDPVRPAHYKLRIVQLLCLSLPLSQCTVIGQNNSTHSTLSSPILAEQFEVHSHSTLQAVAVDKQVGYLELVLANPSVNSKPLVAGQVLTLPTKHLPPSGQNLGITINLGDLRLYFRDDKNQITSWPIGIGRRGKDTPIGSFVVSEKRKKPSWRPTAEHRLENPKLPEVVAPGPSNPLGQYAIRIGSTTFGIHGTNNPTSVGRYVSRGCIRLYDPHIEELFHLVTVGTPIQIVDEPIKTAWIDHRLYLEVHPARPWSHPVSFEQRSKFDRIVRNAAGAHASRINWNAARAAYEARRGIPIAITD